MNGSIAADPMTRRSIWARFFAALPSRLPAVVPAIIVLLGGYWTTVAASRATFAILGRDPGIFQYVAWAIGRGQRDYSDLREINGPLPHFIHLAFMRLGGGDEHVFRVLDMIAQAAVFALVGALLPGIGRRKADACAAPRWWVRFLWAAASAVVLVAQYVMHNWWQTAQRESFYDLFVAASIAIQLWAQRSYGGTRGRSWMLALAGGLGALTWFGKPTNLSFSALQACALFFDEEPSLDRRRALGWFAGGCAMASVVMIASTFAVGDPAAGARIVFGEVPRLYRWIWKLSLVDCYRIWGNAPKLNYAVVTLFGVVVLVVTRVVSRRILVPTALLVGGLVNFFVQGKGFPYHLHPITLGTHLMWLAVAAYAADRGLVSRSRASLWVAPTVLAGAITMGYQASTEARLSEYVASDAWRVGATSEGRQTEAYFRLFPWGDYFPWELREAAAYVDGHTTAADRVQTYGMDPYFLFLAKRVSATPYIYSFELNVDAALQGGSGGAPGADERRWLSDTARRHETEMLAQLEFSPPAAVVLIDRAPFTYPADSVLDLEQHCPRTAAWMHAGYSEAARFGAVHVWLRSDLLH